MASPIPGMTMREFLISLVVISVTFAIATHLFHRIQRYCRSSIKKESDGNNNGQQTNINQNRYNRNDAAPYETEPESAVNGVSDFKIESNTREHDDLNDVQSFGCQSETSKKSTSSVKGMSQ